MRRFLKRSKRKNYALDERENKIIAREKKIEQTLKNQETKHTAELITAEIKGKKSMQEKILSEIENLRGNITKTKLIDLISKTQTK